MITTFAFLFILFSCRSHSLLMNSDYYWRDYKNIIPIDAVIGGSRVDGTNIYIGQAYIHQRGLIVAQINPNEKEIKVPIFGVEKVTQYVKILCGQQNNFYWLQTNKTNLNIDVTNKIVVIGGHEYGLGDYYVGRINYEGSSQIGKVLVETSGDAIFRWADKNDNEPTASEFEILIYDTNALFKTNPNFGFLSSLFKRIFQ